VEEAWQLILEGWRPALEIIILAVTIYYALNFIRGTRGAPVVYGFVVVMLSLTILASVFKLTVLLWLLRNFVALLAFAVLILFQPELRRILAELGNKPLFSTAHEQRENIEVLVQSCERMADAKIGALIAIEQSVGLHDFVESGIPIDCEATPEMLETIFFPNNAIHDGGVILKGDRIAFAACIFPLTQRRDLHPSLGTRHRAAIGLSEETDSIIIIVSEETGWISHCYKGNLVRGVTAEKLRDFLTSLLVSRSKSRNALAWVRSHTSERERVTPGPPVVTKTSSK
jgi:diadenylate cyclase